MNGRTVRVPHAIVMPPAVGDETRNVGLLAGAKNIATTIVPANIVGQSLPVLANAVDPHALTGIAVPIWRMSNVPPVNVSDMLPNTVTCLPPRYASSAT